MKAVRFRVRNFRNIDDSDWIPLEQVTAFVGRNESGKSALLKAFHKFNPATPEQYDAQREFPRDRYTRDYVARGSKGADWPVCSVAFALTDELKAQIGNLLESGQGVPTEAIVTRYYDGSLNFGYAPAIEERHLAPGPVVEALASFASGARRLAAATPDQEEATAAQRSALVEWSTDWQDRLKAKADLRNPDSASLLTTLRGEANGKSNPQTAHLVERLLAAVAPILDGAQKGPVLPRVDEFVKSKLPVLIYFENYGVLDSAVWLPRFLEDHRAHFDLQLPTSCHARRHRLAHFTVAAWLGFTFVMHVRAAQKRHFIENALLEPFEPEINDRRHKKRNHL